MIVVKKNLQRKHVFWPCLLMIFAKNLYNTISEYKMADCFVYCNYYYNYAITPSKRYNNWNNNGLFICDATCQNQAFRKIIF